MSIRRIVVAPSGFKESLSTGIRRVLPGVVVDTLPLVDGGEGSAAALAAACPRRKPPLPSPPLSRSSCSRQPWSGGRRFLRHSCPAPSNSTRPSPGRRNISPTPQNAHFACS